MFPFSRSDFLIVRAAQSVAILALVASSATAERPLFNSSLSFATAGQSIWDSGEAFIFNHSEFIGVDEDPGRYIINPAAASGSTPTGNPFDPTYDWYVDPFLRFDTAFKAGIEWGASINSGSIDANLDYDVQLSAPDEIRRGEPFSLTGSATRLGSSSFQSSPTNASAYVDGVLDVLFRGYMRFETARDMGDHDYRMGNRGFTDDPASNNNLPYRTLTDVNYRPEIIGINRNESGQLHVLGENKGGTGSQYVSGPTTITAGNWNVRATGSLVGDALRGTGQETLVTAELDVDQMVTKGKPVLGNSIQHDWGIIEVDAGYELVDLKTSLEMGLRQDFTIDSQVLVNLQFSENVLLVGVGETDRYAGPLNAIPDVALLTDEVTVTPEFLVDATLNNETDLTFDRGLYFTFLEGHALGEYEVDYLLSTRRGQFMDISFGPYYEWSDVEPVGDIDVYSNRFALGGFDVIAGESFTLSAGSEMSGIAGDYNGNGVVEQADLDLVLLNWGETISDPQSVGWENLAYAPNGSVDQEELDGVLLNWGNRTASVAGVAAGAVPEPGTIALGLLACVVGVAFSLTRKHRHTR